MGGAIQGGMSKLRGYGQDFMDSEKGTEDPLKDPVGFIRRAKLPSELDELFKISNPVLYGIRNYGKDTSPNIDLPADPAAAPDLTDLKLQELAKQQRAAMGFGKNRRSTFITGQSASSTFATPKKTLLGGG